jgi:hypothetical protein
LSHFGALSAAVLIVYQPTLAILVSDQPFWLYSLPFNASLERFPSDRSTHSYHELTDTNGMEDVISSRPASYFRGNVDAASMRDSFKSHRDINGGCFVQVHRAPLLPLLLLLLLVLLLLLLAAACCCCRRNCCYYTCPCLHLRMILQ